MKYFRDNYDKEVKAHKQDKRHHFSFNNRPRRPEAPRYIPPKRENWDQPEQESSEGKKTFTRLLETLLNTSQSNFFSTHKLL
jgi:hypothetical protein